LFTSDDLKEMLSELDDMEKAATTSRSLVREFRTLLSQPAFVRVNTLGDLRRQVASSSSDSYAVVRQNRDVLLALIDKGREENQSVTQFSDTLFHLLRLTDMQVLFAQGARDFFGSPVATEVTQMTANAVVSEMNDILMNEDNEDDEAGG
jgi:hypothetical protein